MPQLTCDLWVVIERGEKRGGPDSSPKAGYVLRDTVFTQRSQAVEFARSGLPVRVEETEIPDGGSVFVAYWGTHIIAVRENHRDAEVELENFDYRELVHHIRYTINTDSFVFDIIDKACLVNIERGEREQMEADTQLA